MYTKSPFIIHAEVSGRWSGDLHDLCEEARALAVRTGIAGISFVYQGHTWLIRRDGSGEEYPVIPCNGGTVNLSRVRDEWGRISRV